MLSARGSYGRLGDKIHMDFEIFKIPCRLNCIFGFPLCLILVQCYLLSVTNVLSQFFSIIVIAFLKVCKIQSPFFM